MQALVYRGRHQFNLEEAPLPKPGPHEVLLRPAYAAVCFSDKHRYEGMSYGQDWRHGLIMGHEFSAYVVEPGEGVEGFEPGDRVAVEPRTYCNECLYCRAGLVTLCETKPKWQGSGHGLDGGYADYCLARDYALYKLPDSVSMEAASMLEPLACATRSLRKAPFSIADNVVILGGEDYSLFLLQWLHRAGANNVVLADPLAHRRAAAEALGATAAIDPTGSPDLAAARELMPRGADQVFVALEDYLPATERYLVQAFEIARPQSTVSILRAYGSAPYAAINGLTPLMKELTIAHAGTFFSQEAVQGGRPRGDWQVSIDALESRAIDTRLPGSVVVEFDDLGLPGAVEDLFGGIPQASTKVVIRIAGDEVP